MRRRRAAILVGSLALGAALAGCSGAGGVDTHTAMESTEAAPVPSSSTPGTSTSAAAGEQSPAREVSCDVQTCTLTLRTGEPHEVTAFGTTLSLDEVEDGVAHLTVGEGDLECSADESVAAGPLTLFCDEVTTGSVTLTAEVG
jgi:hypothetical protein